MMIAPEYSLTDYNASDHHLRASHFDGSENCSASNVNLGSSFSGQAAFHHVLTCQLCLYLCESVCNSSLPTQMDLVLSVEFCLQADPSLYELPDLSDGDRYAVFET